MCESILKIPPFPKCHSRQMPSSPIPWAGHVTIVYFEKCHINIDFIKNILIENKLIILIDSYFFILGFDFAALLLT